MAAERKPLTTGLSVVPPGPTPPDAARAFVKQRPIESESEPKTEPPPESQPQTPQNGRSQEAQLPRKRRSRKGPNPVGLIPVTVRLRPEIAGALKRASLERQLAGEDVTTQQDLVELALEPWLRDNGYLT